MEISQSPCKKISNTAIIGCGNIGALLDFSNDNFKQSPKTHASAFMACSHTNLIALCDNNVKKLGKCAKKYQVNKTYCDYNELFKNENIDILSICTPTEDRYKVMEAALSSGIKTIICEKPVAVSVQGIRDLILLEKKYGAKIGVNFIRRWCDQINKIKDILDSKSYGDVQNVSINYGKGIKNNGSHIFDLVNYFWSNNITLHSKNILNDNLTLTNDATISSSFSIDNIKFNLNATDYNFYSLFEIDIILTGGRIKLLNGCNDIQFYVSEEMDSLPGYKDLKLVEATRNNLANVFTNLIDNAHSVSMGNSNFRSNLEDALDSYLMIEKIYNS